MHRLRRLCRYLPRRSSSGIIRYRKQTRFLREKADTAFFFLGRIAKQALNKSQHASCLHIFCLIARKLLETHQVFLRRFHTIKPKICLRNLHTRFNQRFPKTTRARRAFGEAKRTSCAASPRSSLSAAPKGARPRPCVNRRTSPREREADLTGRSEIEKARFSFPSKRPPPEGPRRRFAPQSGSARPSSAAAAAFSFSADISNTA